MAGGRPRGRKDRQKRKQTLPSSSKEIPVCAQYKKLAKKAKSSGHAKRPSLFREIGGENDMEVGSYGDVSSDSDDDSNSSDSSSSSSSSSRGSGSSCGSSGSSSSDSNSIGPIGQISKGYASDSPGMSFANV